MKIPARIAAIRQETPTVKSLTLDVGQQEFQFLPGQWVDFYAEVGGTVEIAGYSMTSSSLVTKQIELAVKLVGDNPVTHFLHERAREGDLVDIDGGQGDSIFTRGMSESLVLIAGGIGITPIMSILRYVDEAAPEVSATLLYSVGTPEEMLFREQLEAMARRNSRIRCLSTVTRSGDESWTGHTGRIDRSFMDRHGIDREALFYLCGPPAMIGDMAALVQGLGVPDSRVYFEQW